MNEVRKSFVAEPDPSRLSPAQLDSDIDRVVNLLVIGAKIANRQASFSASFPDFGAPPVAGNLYAEILHWPATDDPD
jgi:hypothetical protein